MSEWEGYVPMCVHTEKTLELDPALGGVRLPEGVLGIMFCYSTCEQAERENPGVRVMCLGGGRSE